MFTRQHSVTGLEGPVHFRDTLAGPFNVWSCLRRLVNVNRQIFLRLGEKISGKPSACLGGQIIQICISLGD